MKKVILIGILIAITIIIVLLCYFNLNNKKNTVGQIAYNVNPISNYKVYILENEKYIPYLVLDNNYNNKTLLLRENVIVKNKDYYFDYNGSIYKEKVYKEYMLMNQYNNYEETEVDEFLTTDFINYFDIQFISLIENAKLNVRDSINNSNYQIERKFFLLSIGELGIDNAYDENDNRQLKYFKDNNLIAKNEINEDSIWWTRTYGWNSYVAIGINGTAINPTGTESKYGIRPAFTISSNIKVVKKYIDQIGEEVYILEY